MIDNDNIAATGDNEVGVGGAASGGTITASDAGRTLRQAREDAGKKLDALDAAEKAAAEGNEDPAKVAAAKPKTTADLLALHREQRALGKKSKEVDARSAAADARAKDADEKLKTSEAGASALALAKAGDLLGAVRALGIPKEQLYQGKGSLFMRLAETADAALADKDTRTPEQIKADADKDIETKVQAELDKREAARVKAANEKRAQENAAARQAAVDDAKAANDEVGAFIGAEIAKGTYPFLEDEGRIPDEWVSNPEYVGRDNVAKLRGIDPRTGKVRVGEDGNPAPNPILSNYIGRWAQAFQQANGRAPNQAEITSRLETVTTPGFYENFMETQGKRPSAKDAADFFEAEFKNRFEKKYGRHIAARQGVRIVDTRTGRTEDDVSEEALPYTPGPEDRRSDASAGDPKRKLTYREARDQMASRIK